MHTCIADMLSRYERGEIRRRDLICGIATLTTISQGVPRASFLDLSRR